MPRTPPKPTPPDPDPAITRALTAWFQKAARPLPWRTDIATATPRPRDPYHNLVAESMAQQTQLSRVVPAFNSFTTRFPTVADLAAADEADVLALWSGLGYYRRARNLHAAARAVITDHGGTVPSTAETLISLPGVGRYTAGSIASIVFGQRTPLVDGNVTRVLLRVNGRTDLTNPKAAAAFAWDRAAELVAHADKPGRFNEGLMELGATVCTPPPGLPDCPRCPLRAWCRAFAQGTQDRIPAPKKAKPGGRPTVYCATIVARDTQGRLLMEQRPAAGMWSSMWQCPTLESESPVTRGALRAFAQMRSLDPASLVKLGSLTRQTTHRTMAFDAYTAAPVACRRKQASVRWVAREQLSTLGISNAQMKVIELAAGAK